VLEQIDGHPALLEMSLGGVALGAVIALVVADIGSFD
jgi:hypothetical protein